jgi:hypothetical protein
MLLRAWEIAYRKETFYNGLLEIGRTGKSKR